MFKAPDHWTKEELRVWNGLTVRFPGLHADTERAALRLAVQTGHGGKCRVDYKRSGVGFVARLEVFTLLANHGDKPIVYPVVPDHANPRADKQIDPGMEPFIFTDLKECRLVAEESQSVCLKSLAAAERSSICY